MNLDLKDKTALVGGASQGLGAAIAKELALLGANVILLARTESKLKEVLTSLDVSYHQQHNYIVADTSNPDEVKDKVSAWLATGNIIHILINNTGGPPSGPLLNTSAKDLESAFRSHVITAHLLVQLLFEGMKNAGYGRVINVVSTSVKQPINRLGISNTVRAAVANWSKTLANELAQYGITFNNVLPGSTRTSRLDYLYSMQAERSGISKEEIAHKAATQIPVGRLGEADEFAAAVAFLCSPAASYINGINLPVDGGKLGGL